MQIIFKQNEQGLYCLFDTRSNQFFPGGCVKSVDQSSDLLELANSIARRPFKTILEIAQSPVYGDDGYLTYMLAQKYVSLNPDIKDKVLEKLSAPKVNKKMTRMGKKGRKPKTDKIEAREPVAKVTKNENSVDGEAPVKRGRGRPRKIS